MKNEDPKDQMATEFPEKGRLAGIDFGTVRIGVALTDPDRVLASPHLNYDRRSAVEDAGFFQELVVEENIVGLVVGLPIHTDGEESQKSIEAREFGRWLAEACSRPVDFHDERYTSAFASEILRTGQLSRKKKQKRLDMLAAQIMLSAYLESTRSGPSNTGLAD